MSHENGEEKPGAKVYDLAKERAKRRKDEAAKPAQEPVPGLLNDDFVLANESPERLRESYRDCAAMIQARLEGVKLNPEELEHLRGVFADMKPPDLVELLRIYEERHSRLTAEEQHVLAEKLMEAFAE